MDPSPSESREFVVGTSGHIDHGKTTLVKALTGVDADRFEEEKQRGITIDLGFAPYEDESGTRLGLFRDMKNSSTICSRESQDLMRFYW